MSGPAWTTGTISIAQNADWIVNWKLNLPGGVGDFNLIGHKIKMHIRAKEDDVTALVAISTEPEVGGVLITVPAAGQFTTTILSADSLRVGPKSTHLDAGTDCFADILLIYPDGKIDRMFEGLAIVTRGATHK